jgi:hypothetical protein
MNAKKKKWNFFGGLMNEQSALPYLKKEEPRLKATGIDNLMIVRLSQKLTTKLRKTSSFASSTEEIKHLLGCNPSAAHDRKLRTFIQDKRRGN